MKGLNSLMSFKKIWILPGIISLFVSLLVGKAGILVIFLSGAVIIILELLFDFRKNIQQNPYSLMIFSPLLLIHYSTINDFIIRIICFMAFIYIFKIASSRGIKIKRIQFSSMKPFTVWAMAFLIFSTASIILYVQGVHLSGDEPHYIMVAQSIIEDGDFNLENNIKNKTYYKYLPIDIRFHGKIHNKRYVSYHMPGVSFLLLPFYALYNLLGGLIAPALYFRLVASVINAVFALALYTVLSLQFPEKKITGIWLLFLCLYPLIFHSLHLYPELPAATLMMGAFIFAYGKTKKYILSGLFLSLVAWFHVKYYPALIILAIFIVIQIIKEKKIKQVLLFFLFPLINFVFLLVFCKSLYNTFNPAEILPVQNYFVAPVILRIKIFLAYFLDQRDGLLFYSPIFFLIIFGFKKRLKNQSILLWIGISYVILHSLTTVRGAYSPAGRPLMFVSWIFMIVIANFYYHKPEEENRYGFKILLGFCVFVLIWLFYYPFFAYQPVFAYTTERASNLLLFLGSGTVNLWKIFPSFLTSPSSQHIANYFWIGILIGILLIFYLKIFKSNPIQKYKGFISFFLFVFFTYLFCFYPHVHLIPQNRYSDEKVSFFNNSRNFRFIEHRNGFNILAGQTYKIFFIPKNNQIPIKFMFTNTDKVYVKVYNKTKLLFLSEKKKTDQFSINLSDLKTLKVRKKTIIPIEIKTRTQEKHTFLFLRII